MKILYAIQATGNGHLSRARDIIPILQKKGNVDILVSGMQAEVQIPYSVKYRFNGLGFIFGKNGGIDLWKTYRKSNLRNLFKEISLLPIEQYDLVINDFEPVTAWACYLKNKHCFALSHQAAVVQKEAPKPRHFEPIGNTILRNYAPATHKYGFHFLAYNKKTFTPVIRQQVRNLIPENKGHITVYLPAYSDERILRILNEIPEVSWHVFSKHAEKRSKNGNVDIYPIDNEQFLASMGASSGILCGAGFETPAEALFLGKRLMVIPMKQQVEQQLNAAALKELGIPVIRSLKKKHLSFIRAWLASAPVVHIRYEDNTEHIIDDILKTHALLADYHFIQPGKKAYSVKKLRKLSLRKIILQLTG
jgi:uncharacterized protein (TIGR00661 family)